MMRFNRYMHEWLYGKEGYYRTFKPIGKEGDFYTAPTTSAFFGGAIANMLYEKIASGLLDPNGLWIVEIGAHRGYLLADMVRWLYTCEPKLIETIRFGIIEPQEGLQSAQKSYFRQQFADAIVPYHFKTVANVGFKERIIYVANEIFDAFPCDLYYKGKIATVQSHRIAWEEAPSDIEAFAKRHRLQKGEIAADYETFAKRVAKTAKEIEFITFDYGEAYVRNDFSIRIYQKHKTYPLFDENVRLETFFAQSDITYDVNFAHLIEAFEAAGFEKEAYETQARALVRFGIIRMLETYAKSAPYSHYLREADKIKTLISPTIMGDRFKLLHLKRSSNAAVNASKYNA